MKPVCPSADGADMALPDADAGDTIVCMMNARLLKIKMLIGNGRGMNQLLNEQRLRKRLRKEDEV